jgi:uncharacterized membrane protein YphA (DoxX/SURF4 family)
MRASGGANTHAMAFLRIAVGILFILFAQSKIFGNNFAHGGFESLVHRYLREGSVYPFMVPVLHNDVLPHAAIIAYVIAYLELAIGLALVLGVLVTTASVAGLVYMLAQLFSSNYPGAHATPFGYVAASMDHLVLALCFLTLILGAPEKAWSVQIQFRSRQ